MDSAGETCADGSRRDICAKYLAALDPLRRTSILTSLCFERLQYKADTIIDIYRRSDSDWNQTFYTMFLRSMGGSDNGEAFAELARRVPYAVVLRERDSIDTVESLLTGASGLLQTFEGDRHLLHSLHTFAHLQHKYSIEPMRASQWRTRGIYPQSNPILRMAQAAALLYGVDIITSAILDCRTAEDVYRLFAVAASEYWDTHYTPARTSARKVKYIGRAKCDMLAVNLVAQLQCVYGAYTENETLRERSLSLLESVAAESNRYTKPWERAGVHAANAFESQALLHLATRYCACGLCSDCPVGRKAIKSI